MAKFKDREAKEAPYIEHNKDVLSVCSGSFYIKGRNIHEPCKNREKCQKYAKYKDKKEDSPEVGFYYVDSFRKCDLWRYRTIDGAYALQISMYSILYVNDLACACIIDMKDKVKTQDKETQKIFMALQKRQFEYEKMLANILKEDIEMLADINLFIDDRVQVKVKALLDSILKFLKYKNVENFQFVGLTEMAFLILDYSLAHIDNMMRVCLKYTKEGVYLQCFKLTDIRNVAFNLCKWVERKCKDVNMNDSEEILDSFHSLNKMLTDVNLIGNAFEQAKEKRYVV